MNIGTQSLLISASRYYHDMPNDDARTWPITATLCNRGPLYFCPVVSSFLLFSSPNVSRCRLDVYHTLTHGVALVRI